MTMAARLLVVLLAGLFPALAAASGELPPVAVTEARTSAVQKEIQVTGSVVSLADAMVSTTVAGRVETLEADLGDRVEAGAPLLRLDTELEDTHLASARASLAEAGAALADSRRRLREARDLGPSRGISESEIRSLESEVAVNEAVRDRRRAELRRQQVQLERHVLRAPFSGVVSHRQVDPGEWVTPGTGVMGLVSLEQLRLDFAVAQQHFSGITEQTDIRVRLEALPDSTLDARIDAIVPVKDVRARTFTIRARFDNSEPLPVTPGMSVRGILSVDTGRESVVVPRDALLRHPDGRVTLWRVLADGDENTVEERQVRIGLAFNGRVEIREGLAAGETVVVRGNEALREGQGVRISERLGN